MSHILNIAHRGFTKVFPDNTLEAFKAAIEIRADGIEFDVRETADHEFVVFHDPQLQGEDIDKMSLMEIRSVKLKQKFEIPTLEETLDLCKGRVQLMVEVKQVSSVNRFLTLRRARVEPVGVIVTSFNGELVLKLSQLAPEIRRGIITFGPVEDPTGIAESTKSDAIAVRFPFATTELADKIHAHNLSIYVWGCTDLRDIQSTLRLDIDGIVSDFPDLVAKELSRKA